MIKLLGNKILVRAYVAKKTKNGILIPDSAQKVPTIGEILAVGNAIPKETGCEELKIGDFIKFNETVALAQTNSWIEYDKELLLLMSCYDVIGIVEKPVEEPTVDSGIILQKTAIN